MRTGVLAHAEGTRRLQATASKLDRVPMCTACQYGRQKRRSSPGKHTVKDRMNEGALKKNNLLPGQQTSVDHFVSKIRGRLVSSYGKEDTEKQYCGGAVFVDLCRAMSCRSNYGS